MKTLADDVIGLVDEVEQNNPGVKVIVALSALRAAKRSLELASQVIGEMNLSPYQLELLAASAAITKAATLLQPIDSKANESAGKS